MLKAIGKAYAAEAPCVLADVTDVKVGDVLLNPVTQEKVAVAAIIGDVAILHRGVEGTKPAEIAQGATFEMVGGLAGKYISPTESEVLTGLDFGQALRLMKRGRKLTRPGWNGKGLYVVYQKGYPDGIGINRNTAEATGIPEGTLVRFLPYLMIRTVDGCFVPWTITQTDALAIDWTVV